MQPNSNSSAGNGTNTPVSSSTVILTDCLEFMATLPDNHFDLAIVDPEYGIGVHKMFIAKDRKDPRNGRLIKTKRTVRGEWDNKRPEPIYFQELQRVSKNQIIWGGNYFADLLPPSMGWIIWDKVNGESDQADCEMAWTSFNRATRIIRYMWCIAQGKSMTEGHIAQGNNKLWEKKIHPTQKPVILYDWIYKNYAKPGMKIFDSHLGSGSNRISAAKNKMDFTGTEISKHYYTEQEKRWNNWRSQLRIENW